VRFSSCRQTPAHPSTNRKTCKLQSAGRQGQRPTVPTLSTRRVPPPAVLPPWELERFLGVAFSRRAPLPALPLAKQPYPSSWPAYQRRCVSAFTAAGSRSAPSSKPRAPAKLPHRVRCTAAFSCSSSCRQRAPAPPAYPYLPSGPTTAPTATLTRNGAPPTPPQSSRQQNGLPQGLLSRELNVFPAVKPRAWRTN